MSRVNTVVDKWGKYFEDNFSFLYVLIIAALLAVGTLTYFSLSGYLGSKDSKTAIERIETRQVVLDKEARQQLVENRILLCQLAKTSYSYLTLLEKRPDLRRVTTLPSKKGLVEATEPVSPNCFTKAPVKKTVKPKPKKGAPKNEKSGPSTDTPSPSSSRPSGSNNSSTTQLGNNSNGSVGGLPTPDGEGGNEPDETVPDPDPDDQEPDPGPVDPDPVDPDPVDPVDPDPIIPLPEVPEPVLPDPVVDICANIPGVQVTLPPLTIQVGNTCVSASITL